MGSKHVVGEKIISKKHCSRPRFLLTSRSFSGHPRFPHPSFFLIATLGMRIGLFLLSEIGKEELWAGSTVGSNWDFGYPLTYPGRRSVSDSPEWGWPGRTGMLNQDKTVLDLLTAHCIGVIRFQVGNEIRTSFNTIPMNLFRLVFPKSQNNQGGILRNNLGNNFRNGEPRLVNSLHGLFGNLSRFALPSPATPDVNGEINGQFTIFRLTNRNIPNGAKLLPCQEVKYLFWR